MLEHSTLLLNTGDQLVVRGREGGQAVMLECARDGVIGNPGCGLRGHRRARLVNPVSRVRHTTP
jgi:hypothetical protein